LGLAVIYNDKMRLGKTPDCRTRGYC